MISLLRFSAAITALGLLLGVVLVVSIDGSLGAIIGEWNPKIASVVRKAVPADRRQEFVMVAIVGIAALMMLCIVMRPRRGQALVSHLESEAIHRDASELIGGRPRALPGEKVVAEVLPTMRRPSESSPPTDSLRGAASFMAERSSEAVTPARSGRRGKKSFHLSKCRACDHSVSFKATKCLHCGEPDPADDPINALFALGLVIFIVSVWLS